tara:strand:- start:22166 stop:22849 length:684 start_codon:yes stop_codon:yes gene_type:complete
MNHKNKNTRFLTTVLFVNVRNKSINKNQKSNNEKLFYKQNHQVDLGDCNYIIFEEKIPTVEVYVPKNIPRGLSKLIISKIGNNMCYLNPQLRGEKLHHYLNHLDTLCEEPLGIRVIDKIYTELERKSQLGLINPIYTRQRKVFFRKDCPIEIRNKITAIASGKVRSENTYRQIDEALNDWDLNKGKITNKTLANFAEVHENTIKKYFKNHPELRKKKSEINKAIFKY